jgi:uncharacterized protein (DUF433 family)
MLPDPSVARHYFQEETMINPKPSEICDEPWTPPEDPLPVREIRGVKTPVTLVREDVGDEPYEYYPLGEHIVSAPGVCRGRPTFKYTRIDVRHALGYLAAGVDLDEISIRFGGGVSREALQEAERLAGQNDPQVFERPFLPPDRAA